MDQISELLSSYACRLNYEDLDPGTVHQIKRTLVDTLGCAIGGYQSEPAKIARRLAGSVTSSAPARIIGTQDYSSMDMAGFANGVMVRCLDCNDAYYSPGGGHPSDMIPAALAVADTLERDGRSVITAIALAYEVFCRLADQVVTSDLGWDYGMFSGIGAACAAGKVLGLDQKQMGHAISLAITPNLPLGATRVGEIPMWKGCATASATRSAIFAAQLASENMTGPDNPFEGRKGLWEQAGVTQPVKLDQFGGNGEDFRINRTIFKSYPSQIHTQSPIGLAIELHRQVDLSQIESINIKSYKSMVSNATTEPEKWDPKTRETADHSIPYVVAVALTDGAVTPDSFAARRISDPALRLLMSKMSMEEDPEFTRRYSEEYNCRIEISTKSGQSVVAETSFPKGHPNNPLSDAEISDKFRNLAQPNLTDRQCSEALDLLWRLEDLPNLEGAYDNLVV